MAEGIETFSGQERRTDLTDKNEEKTEYKKELIEYINSLQKLMEEL